MKRIKKLLASILTLAMTFSVMGVASVEAVKDVFTFKEENTYALISNTNNKAIYIHNINWGNNDTKMQMEIIQNLEKFYKFTFKNYSIRRSKWSRCF